MKLRLGQPVSSLDGPYGDLGDIVIDPTAKTVTHLVVEPAHKHRLARLVPMWLIESDDDTITVQLDTKHLRQLQGASFADYVRFTEPIDLGDDWDIGTEDTVSMPIPELDAGMWGDDHMGVEYDRIPRGDVEIRRRSTVASSEGQEIGHVAGMVIAGDDVTGIAVRSGSLGRRHDSLVTIDKIERVRNDRVVLTIDRHEFQKLPSTEAFDDGDISLTEMSRERVDAAVVMAADAGMHLMDKAKSALRRA